MKGWMQLRFWREAFRHEFRSELNSISSYNPRLAQVIHAHFQFAGIASIQPNFVFYHPAAQRAEHAVTVLQFDFILMPLEHLNHLATDSECFLFHPWTELETGLRLNGLAGAA